MNAALEGRIIGKHDLDNFFIFKFITQIDVHMYWKSKVKNYFNILK